MHICLPYSMLEPIRDLLDAGVQSDRGERDERWEHSMKEETMGARVELSSILAETQISMKDLAELKKGDIIPLDIQETVDVLASDIPVFRGKLGVFDGNYAIKHQKWLGQKQVDRLQELLKHSQE